MIQTLLDANNFGEAFIQGMIKGIIMLLFFLAISGLFKMASKKKNKEKIVDLVADDTSTISKETENIKPQSSNSKIIASNQNQLAFKKFYNYFFVTNINKGYKRLLIVGSFILPLGLALILYYSSAVEGTNMYDQAYVYYDDSTIVTGFILGYILYWTIYCVTIWIVKGFQDAKKVN